jgi:hypothetical protein
MSVNLKLAGAIPSLLFPSGGGGGGPQGVPYTVPTWADLATIPSPVDDTAAYVTDHGYGGGGLFLYNAGVWRFSIGSFSDLVPLLSFPHPISGGAVAYLFDGGGAGKFVAYSWSSGNPVSADAGGGTFAAWLPLQVNNAGPELMAFIDGDEPDTLTLASHGWTVTTSGTGGITQVTDIDGDWVRISDSGGTGTAFLSATSLRGIGSNPINQSTRFYIRARIRAANAAGTPLIMKVTDGSYTPLVSRGQTVVATATSFGPAAVGAPPTLISTGQLKNGGQPLDTSGFGEWIEILYETGAVMTTVYRNSMPYSTCRGQFSYLSAAASSLLVGDQLGGSGIGVEIDFTQFILVTW